MSLRNTTLNITLKVARLKAEHNDLSARITRIEADIEALPSLRGRVAKLDSLIAAAEMLLQDDNPEWSADDVQPRRKTDHTSPIPYGELGRTALEVMRDAPPEGWPAREIMRRVCARFDIDASDRAMLDRKTNSLGIYLKKYEGDLVENDGADFYKRWRLIREAPKTPTKKTRRG